MRSLGIGLVATGAVNSLVIEIFGEQGALRLDLADPNRLYVHGVRDPGKPLGGQRGFTRVETVQRFEDHLTPDWTMPMSFGRSHAECQYQFLKAVREGRPAQPDLRTGARVQGIMEGARLASAEGRWVDLAEVREAEAGNVERSHG